MAIETLIADDTLMDRRVALGVVGERQLRGTPGAAEILGDEARTGGKLLGHPRVVAVLDLLDVGSGLHRGPAVVMEHVDGCDVAEWISEHSLRVDAATRQRLGLYIAPEATEALSEAHKIGVLHRDSKPQNTLCATSGRVEVADSAWHGSWRPSPAPAPSGRTTLPPSSGTT
ncbi:hypothetical protein [Saccharothrix saharensis]|uniref:hypothetical protein n=1 Tax=Saccharothrix saharensis TaxID=571190 RepID=UPI001478AEE9|nr:hypothetical protein [Saccharothrix saharensis]